MSFMLLALFSLSFVGWGFPVRAIDRASAFSLNNEAQSIYRQSETFGELLIGQALFFQFRNTRVSFVLFSNRHNHEDSSARARSKGPPGLVPRKAPTQKGSWSI